MRQGTSISASAAHLLCQSQVGLEEGLDGSDVLPVAVEEVGHDAGAGGSAGNDLPAKVIALALFPQQLQHEVLLEHVDAHGCNEGAGSCLFLAQT